jgi:hypothetical protein
VVLLVGLNRRQLGCAGRRVKLLVDMNLSPTWVNRLDTAGFPAVHWSGTGRQTPVQDDVGGTTHEFAFPAPGYKRCVVYGV